VQQHQITRAEQRMADDFEWSRKAADVQENPEHYGKLVVVCNRRVRAVGRDRQALVERAARDAGVPAEQLVVILVPRPGIWETPD